MDNPLALYRRYRPETFSDLIGQDHVTGPLREALAGNRVNHAYLFSGPRGCGKTTSARILARALNCEQAPTADPCGECPSCRDLARNGSGSLDVVEIDAASHGGVEDTRDLRERAFFNPVRDRYKVYIIDEAHMVSPQGFNALLKLVEEPPEHLRFIFATTAPDKVLGTIKSRTHHYPFRLIPPRQLTDYLTAICVQEGVTIDPAAISLVVRAGGGSARDSLSILDQLMGGAGKDGVTLELAAGLLGFAPESLLDEVVDALASVDGAALFAVVDRVIEVGQDPRRFAEDLLRRLRDLVIISAVPDAASTGLLDVPADQADRLAAQAARMGRAELIRAADLLARGLTDLKGTTAPRLLLELLLARILLPGVDHQTEGLIARMDRLERRASVAGAVISADHGSTPTAPAPVEAARGVAAARQAMTPPPAEPEPAAPASQKERAADQPRDEPAAQPAQPVAESAPAVVPEVAPPGALSLGDVRRLWPQVVEATKQRRRVAWMILQGNADVVALDERTLTLGFNNAGARDSFTGGGCEEIVRQAVIDVVGADWRIECIVDPGTQPRTEVPATASRADSRRSSPAPVAPAAAEAAPTEEPTAPDWARPAEPEAGAKGESAAAARERISATRSSAGQTESTSAAAPEDAFGGARPDDDDVADDHLAGAELLVTELGAQVISETRNDR